MTRVYDITPPITHRLGVWPGDTPVSREVLLDLARGDTVTLSTIRTTVHLGAHADGPNHYTPGTSPDAPAHSVGEWPLDRFLGPCHVLDARVARATRVKPADVTWPEGRLHPRVLIRTGTFPDFEAWNTDFAGLSPELIDELARRAVVTVGVDTPSVDLQESKDLPAHTAIARHAMAILEGLALAGVPAGAYELIALPLRLIGFDASPVRAVLRELPANSLHTDP